MSVITQTSAFAPSLKAPSLFSSKSAFKRPIQGLSTLNSIQKPITFPTIIQNFQIPEEKQFEQSKEVQSNSDSEVIFMEPVKKLKTGHEEQSSMDCPNPLRSVKLTMEDVFNTGVKKECDEIFGEEEEEDCDLSFISDDSLEEELEKSVEEKLKADKINDELEAELEETEDKEVQEEKEVMENEEDKEEKVVEPVVEAIQSIEPEEPVKAIQSISEEPVEVIQSVQSEEPVEEEIADKSDFQSTYVHDATVNSAEYYAEMRDYMAYNQSYNSSQSYNSLQNLYQSNQYSSELQQYALLQRMQRERYSGYMNNNNYLSNEMLMAYNLSLNNASYNNSLSSLSQYQTPSLNSLNYYMPSYPSVANSAENNYMQSYYQLQQQQLQQQQQQQLRMEQRNLMNRSAALYEENSRRAKLNGYEESGDDSESYTTMCPAESASRDTADNSDSSKSQKEYSPYIVAGKEVQKDKEIVGVKRPFVEEQIGQKTNDIKALQRNNKLGKNKPAKEAKADEANKSNKKREFGNLKQDMNPAFGKVERKLNRYQLLRYQQGGAEEDAFLKQLETSSDKETKINKINTNKALSQPEEESEEDLRAVLPPFLCENDSQKRRRVKLVWTPESVASENMDIYIKKLEEVTDSPVVSQQDAIKLLVSNGLDVLKAVETANSNPDFYTEVFRLKVKKTRGRRAVYVESSN